MKPATKGCAPWLPARFILAFLGFTGITLQYIMKVNLSVGIVAMVKTDINNETSDPGSCWNGNSTDNSNEDDDGEFNWNISKQSLLLSSYYYGYITTQFLGGYLAQRFGGRILMGAGIATTGFLTLLTTYVARRTYNGLLILRALEGVASGLVIPSMQTMFSLWFPPQERQRFAGFIFSSINFGSLAGLSISGLLASWGGWPLIFYGTGSLAIAWFIPWMFLAYDSPKTHPRITNEEKNYIIEGLGQDPASQHMAPKRVPWLHIFLSLPVWAGILVHTGSSWVLYTLLNELPTYLKNVLHFNVKNSGILSALPHLFAWISANFSGALSQWLRAKGYLGHLAAYKVFNSIMTVGVSSCFLVIIFIGCQAHVIVGMFILSMFFHGFIYGGSYLNHVDLAPNHAGVIAGLLHTVLNIPGFLTPIVTWAFIQEQHTIERWHNVFYLTIGILCGVLLLYLVFGSVTPQPWNSWGVEDEESNEKQDNSKKIATISTNLKNGASLPNYGS